MKFILLLVLTCWLSLRSECSIFLERQPVIAGHEGQCYDKEAGSFYNRGNEMEWRGTECARKICAGSSGYGHSIVEIQTCGKIVAPTECLVQQNPNLPYPKCCGWIVCPKSLKETFETDNEIA